MTWQQGTHLTWIKKSTDALSNASKEVGLEIKVQKTKYMSYHQNAGENCDIKIANRSSENVLQFKYL
jgi:hypothetical protein